MIVGSTDILNCTACNSASFELQEVNAFMADKEVYVTQYSFKVAPPTATVPHQISAMVRCTSCFGLYRLLIVFKTGVVTVYYLGRDLTHEN